jgi:mRNA-degrading endonuclease toxin of MazEF toxin-antitoxin module
MRLPGLLLLAALGCGPSGVDIPDAPAGSLPPVDLYDNPTGTVPLDQLAALSAEVEERMDRVDDSRLDRLLRSLLEALRQRLDAGGFPTDPADEGLKADVDGFVRVDRICRGWGDAVAPDPQDGTLDVTAVVRDGKLERDLWATASACRARVDLVGDRVSAAAHGFVDGTLGITLLGPLPTSVRGASFAVHLTGTLGTEQRRAPITLDFRLIEQRIEVLRTVEDGVVVGSVGVDGIALRGRNGSYGCSVSMSTCGPEAPQ